MLDGLLPNMQKKFVNFNDENQITVTDCEEIPYDYAKENRLPISGEMVLMNYLRTKIKYEYKFIYL